jgi:tetratricopeptide (TPR) repeat protein
LWRTEYLQDSEALARLESLAKESLVKYLALRFLAKVYEQAGSLTEAEAAYRLSIESTPRDRERSRHQAAISLSSLLTRRGRRDEARTELEHALSAGSPDRDTESDLYEALAVTLDSDKERLLRASALQRAALLAPTDAVKRFNAAYAFAQISGKDSKNVALFDYNAVLALNRDHIAACNNLGVTLQVLELPAMSIQAFRRASELGNTLATANLAARYLDGGFLEEAQKALASASTGEDVHENVGHVLARAAAMLPQETERQTEIASRGAELSQFGADLIAALSRPGRPIESGDWHDADGKKFVFEIEGEKLVGNEGEETRFRGTIRHSGVVGIVQKNKWSLSANEMRWTKVGEFFLVRTATGAELGLWIESAFQRRTLKRA